MVETRGEFVVLLLGAILFAVAACFPDAFIRVLGAGRVHPSKRGVVGFRLLAAICSVGVFARLFIHS
jgi:hypothetical protein